MLKNVLIILVVILLLQYLEPRLKPLRLGRLPGDLRFILFKRVWYLPLSSAFLLTLVLEFAAKLI